jgi:hypothetical protein
MYLGITDRDRGAPCSAKDHFAAALKRCAEIGDKANATVVKKMLAMLQKEFPDANTNGASADGWGRVRARYRLPGRRTQDSHIRTSRPRRRCKAKRCEC